MKYETYWNFEILKKNRKYFSCLTENGYKCKLAIDSMIKEL